MGSKLEVCLFGSAYGFFNEQFMFFGAPQSVLTMWQLW